MLFFLFKTQKCFKYVIKKTCFKQSKLKDNSLNFTIRNVALERVVDRFTSKAKSAVEVKCTYCAPPPEAATKTCVDCSVS